MLGCLCPLVCLACVVVCRLQRGKRKSCWQKGFLPVQNEDTKLPTKNSDGRSFAVLKALNWMKTEASPRLL